MNTFIKKTIAITLALLIFVSVNSFGAIGLYPKRNTKSNAEVMKMALNMDRIIENDLTDMKNCEVVKQAYKMDAFATEGCGPTKEELNELSLMDLYYIDPTLVKTKISQMKYRDARDEIKVAISHFAKIYDIDDTLIMAIVKQESYFNHRAQSPKYARGLMQLMKGTAIEMGVKDRFHPFENLEGGIKYFKLMLTKFGGDEKLALAAYNAGPYKVIKYNGIPPYNETQDYVKSVLEYRKKYNDNERTV